MGYFKGQRENPCPRCGGIVHTLFISVSPVSFDQRCEKCETWKFTEEEEKQLGANKSEYDAFDKFVMGQ